MKGKRKLLVSMLLVAFVLLSIIATVAIAFALTQQTIKTSLNIGYTVEDIDGTASATFTIGGVTENLTAMKGENVIGDTLVFKAGDTENAGNLMFPEDALALTAQNDNVVIQYTYSNTGAKHYIASMNFDGNIEADNMKVEYSIDGVTYSEDRYAVVVPANTSNKSYWIKISIEDKAKSASFTGDFNWLLNGCDPQDASYLSLTSLEFQQADDYNGSLVAGSYKVSIANSGSYIGQLIFPSSVNGDPVTTIAQNKSLTDTQKAQVTSAYIPDSVETIGPSAFYGFTNLETVTLEQNESLSVASVASASTGLKTIDDTAFYNCAKLKGIKIPATVTRVGMEAFTGCANLTSIEVESGNTTYHSAGNCLIITASKTLRVGCKTSVIPTDSSVTSINALAFSGHTGLTNIVIPDCVTSIVGPVFYNCTGLTNITIGSSVPSIDSYVFMGCTNLKNVTLRTLNENVVSAIKSLANTNGEMNLTIENVTSIRDSAFNNFLGLTNVTIGSSVTYIGVYAFGSTGITSITIPKNVTTVYNYSFYGCNELTTIIVDSDNTKYHSAGNCIIETESKTLIRGCKTSVIPTDGSVTSIGEEAFVGCSALTQIVIPEIVTSIGSGAFNGCTGLTNLTFENKTEWTGFDKYQIVDGGTYTFTVADLENPANAATLLKEESKYLWYQLTRTSAN